ncbi:MAG: hypothetical protein HZA54_18950 [Planctomycetes bacterium]|nr:hypothetical protein [Planctomycetota bacterium]
MAWPDDADPAAAPVEPPRPPQYVIREGTLIVSKDPKFSDPEFQRHCDLLLNTPYNPIVIDLSKVAYIQSPEIACLILFIKKARAAKKAVELKISKTVFTVLKLMNLHHLAGLHKADEPES